MISLPPAVRIFLARDPADMRRGFDGLAALTASALGQDPLSGHLFVFRNRRGDRLKVLYWDRDGLAIWMKRLERGTFRFPPPRDGRVEVTPAELAAILEGIDLERAPRRPRFTLPPAPPPAHGDKTAWSPENFSSRRADFPVYQGMTTAPCELPDDLATAHELIRELAGTVHTQGHLIAKLQHQLEQLLRHRFGRKSEKLDPAQLLLFAREILAELAAAPAEAKPAEPEPPAPPPARKEGHGRKPLPAGLPRRRVLHDLDPGLLPCPDCGTARVVIGEEVREQLEYVPASLLVLQHVRPKYACKACEGNVAIADRLPEPIEKGLPGPGLLAHVIVSKYADHLPLYRQERIFLRHGVALSRRTTCGWMATCAELLEPIYRAMLERVLLSRVLGTDDTPVKVQDPDTGAMSTGRIWDYIGDRAHPFVVYDFTPDHCASGPMRILAGFRGEFLQADAYAGYDRLFARGVLEAGCMAHARRKFDEAKTTDPPRAHAALAYIGRLYRVEREARELIDEAIGRLDEEGPLEVAARRAREWSLADEITHKLRREQSAPVAAKFEEWLKTAADQVLPKSPIGQAIAYARNHWAALTRYLGHGFLPIDNNAAERSLRPVAVGRKNWLHLGSERGGRTAAVLMSLVESCRRCGVEPFAYIRDLLIRVNTHPASRIAELLPDVWVPAPP